MIRKLLKTEPLGWYIAGCLAAAFACVFTYNIADPDLWGHVRYGADMLERGRLFLTDPYSYTSHDFLWINHELLCEFLLGYLEPRSGAFGLIAWKLLMGAITVGCIAWSHRRNRFEPVTIVLIAVLLVLNLRLGWVVRPQIFTYTFLSVLVLLLTEHSRGSDRAIWFAPPLIAVWTNAHGGFVAGLCILAAYAGTTALEQLWRRAPGSIRRLFPLAAVVCLSAGATLLNPYGVRLLTWTWESLTWPRPEIAEWAAVPFWSLEYAGFKSLVAVAAVSLIGSRLPRDPARVVILLLTAVQAFLHLRHIPLFAICAAYWVPEHTDHCVRRLREWAGRAARLSDADTAAQAMYKLLFTGLGLMFTGIAFTQMAWLRVDKAVYPVSACEFIAERSLEGRMVTEFNWGQYCLYAFWPRILVSVDGRFDTSYSREVLDLNLDFMMGDHPRWRHRSPKTGPFQPDRVLDVGVPNLALIDRGRTECVRVIAKRPDWALLYQDALAQLWGRRAIYDDPAAPTYIPPSERRISDAPQEGQVAYPAVPLASRAAGAARWVTR